jgi:hypothetical protein
VPGPPVPGNIARRGQISPSSLGGWAYVAMPVQPCAVRSLTACCPAAASCE